jgi:hypothetical protein
MPLGRELDWLPATEAKWREQNPFWDHFKKLQREQK